MMKKNSNEITFQNALKENIALSDYKDHVLLIVNTASH